MHCVPDSTVSQFMTDWDLETHTLSHFVQDAPLPEKLVFTGSVWLRNATRHLAVLNGGCI